jgi:putative mycofactocin binding protein MftB
VRGLLSVTEAPSTAAPEFRSDQPCRLHPQVALRDESFGALAYHYGTRRLLFLKSKTLVGLVSSLENYDSADAAIAALVPEAERSQYRRALSRLAASEVICVTH